ncbi:hypothetical protein [Dactylosporangium sp. NPDC051541]|uniref:hypothetical protein n=1 Tax=Dactylosporangium sp. NPDC051541 TaxID=3363977 RepID=UPI0037A10451
MGVRLRTLHVGARDFVWRTAVRYVPGSEGACLRVVRVRVWGGGKQSRVLQADLAAPVTDESWHPTPKDVKAVVERALAHGWRPDVRGGMYVMRNAQFPAM